jgi:hypothetical protein
MLWKKPGQFFVLQMGRDFLCFRTNGNYFFMHIGAGSASLPPGGKATSYLLPSQPERPYFDFTTISISSGCLFNQACTKGQYTFTGR